MISMCKIDFFVENCPPSHHYLYLSGHLDWAQLLTGLDNVTTKHFSQHLFSVSTSS